MTTDNFYFYLQNRLIQTSQTGGQRYSDTSPFSIPWCMLQTCTFSTKPQSLLKDVLKFGVKKTVVDWVFCLWAGNVNSFGKWFFYDWTSDGEVTAAPRHSGCWHSVEWHSAYRHSADQYIKCGTQRNWNLYGVLLIWASFILCWKSPLCWMSLCWMSWRQHSMMYSKSAWRNDFPSDDNCPIFTFLLPFLPHSHKVEGLGPPAGIRGRNREKYLIIAWAIFTFAVRHHKKPVTLTVAVLALAPLGIGTRAGSICSPRSPRQAQPQSLSLAFFDAAQ